MVSAKNTQITKHLKEEWLHEAHSSMNIFIFKPAHMPCDINFRS